LDFRDQAQNEARGIEERDRHLPLSRSANRVTFGFTLTLLEISFPNLMLPFFPSPYPDELLYSTFARYQIRNANPNPKQNLTELLGYVSTQPYQVLLPSNLNYLVKHLDPRAGLNLVALIKNYTLAPFYKNFLSPKEARQLIQAMESKPKPSIYEIAKLPSPEHLNHYFLRFCPACVESDYTTLGETYLRRTHQIPGMAICPTHQIRLQNSELPVTERNLSLHANLLQELPNLKDEPTPLDPATQEQLSWLSQQLQSLCTQPFFCPSMSWLRDRYQAYLIELGFLSQSRTQEIRLDEVKLSQAMFDYYGEGLLEVVRPPMSKNLSYYWANCLLACDMNPVRDRLTHLLLMTFLAGSLENFFQGTETGVSTSFYR
jgi:hypothetical protein